MQYIKLGRTNLSVSRICFGCAGIGGYDYGPVDNATSIAALRHALDVGINFFDVADVYGFGRSESLLHSALGPRLKSVVVGTKFGVHWDAAGKTHRDISPRALRLALEASLGRLGLESIPLYQIHWPDGKTLLEDCIAELESCRTAGKVQHYGACNLGLADIERGQAAGRLETIQLPYSLAEKQNAADLHACHEHHGMSTMIYNALGHGLFTGKYDIASRFTGTDLRTRIPLFKGEAFERALEILNRVRELASRHQRSCAEITLSWCLAQPGIDIVIVGAKNPAQVGANARAADCFLPDSDLGYLS